MNMPIPPVKPAAWPVFLFSLSLLLHPGLLKAQDFDYTAKADSSIDYTEVTVELGIQPQNLTIDGAATYQFKAKADSVETLRMNASDMEIQYVLVDEQEVDFQLKKDSLIIPLPFMALEGEEHTTKIRYSTTPGFGLLKDRHNNVWTSMLPHAVSHWIPVADQPQNRLKASFTISLPSGYQVWAAGKKITQEPVNDDIMQYRFASDVTMPVTEMGFALGHFRSDSTTYQDTKINLAVAQSLVDSVDGDQLLQKAKEWMGSIEEKTQAGYPFGSLTIVVLEDHNWETKSWGASTIFLYKNRGNLQHQLLRGLAGQWASGRSLPVRWKQADAVTLYQSLLQQSLGDEKAVLEITDQPRLSFDTVYDQFGPERWNAWQKQWNNWKQESSEGLFSNIPPNLLGQFLLNLSGPEYSEYWNDAPLFQLPDQEKEQDSAENESPQPPAIYEVNYSYNEAGGSVSLSFNAVEGSINEPMQLGLFKAYENQTDRADIEFTGKRDSIVVSVDAGLRSAWLSVPEGLKLKLEEHKPVSFLLYQMRNAETVQQRARAARGLGTHSDNPDIQLAVDDALSSNIKPEVRAGLLAALADITDGATGTEQTFVKALQHDEKAVRRAGLYGLQNYPESEVVQRQIRQFAANAQDSTLFGEAITAYAGLVSAEELKSFLLETRGEDSTGRRALTAVKYLSKSSKDTTLATDLLSPFLSTGHAFEVRRRALGGLTAYDQSPESWLARGKEALAESADPRIRYLVAQGMLKNSSAETMSFLEEYLPTEADARVHQQIEQAIQQGE